MIIVWRGWGLLALVIGFLGAGLGAWLGSTTSDKRLTPMFVALGGALGGAVTWWVGQQLNKVRPEKTLAAEMERLRQAYAQLVEQGQFHRGPGFPAPTSLEDARAQAAAQLNDDFAALNGILFNQHTLFWVPMQYVGIFIVGISTLLAVLLPFTAR